MDPKQDQSSGKIPESEVSENFTVFFGRKSTNSLIGKPDDASTARISFTNVKDIIEESDKGDQIAAAEDDKTLTRNPSSKVNTFLQQRKDLSLRSVTDDEPRRHVPSLSRPDLSPKPVSAKRASLFASTLARQQKNLKSRFKRGATPTTTLTRGTTPAEIRRYKPGDKVLVHNAHARFTNLVNKHGYPPGQGETSEEKMGPYSFVLAIVQKVHFEDIAVFYTVTRYDTGVQQRAEADFMEPMRTAKGEAAAMRAMQVQLQDRREEGEHQPTFTDSVRQMSGPSNILFCLYYACLVLAFPFLWTFSFLSHIFVSCIRPYSIVLGRFIRRQAQLILNGLEPYVCRFNFTAVNFVVICDIWFLFIDQARIAFFSADADHAIAVVSFIVWIVLVIELCFQVFIRPDGYRSLVVSEKAYAPTTIRYICAFHLAIETFSLAIFVPEFLCLFSSYTCSENIPFSFLQATVRGLIGPGRLDIFYGKGFHALIRLRVFTMVRHWKNMWATATYTAIPTRKRLATDILSNLVPGSRRKALAEQKVDLKDASEWKGPKDQEVLALTNASTIGTALMSTNSYRSMAILWLVVGVFPVLSSLMSLYANTDARDANRLLQSTNIMVQDDSATNCAFLILSLRAWLTAVISPDFGRNRKSAYVLTIDTEPQRCSEVFAPFPTLRDGLCFVSLSQIEQELAAATEEAERKFWEYQKFLVSTICDAWEKIKGLETRFEIAQALHLREGALLRFTNAQVSNYTISSNGTTFETRYSTSGIYDETYAIETAAFSSFLLQLAAFVVVIGGLSLLRRDTEILVLGPLRRMLKIVAQYAKNPLVRPKRQLTFSRSHRLSGRGSKHLGVDDSNSTVGDSDSEDSSDENELALGSFETEQLITAVTRITDLLRKCWGVAGADIISTNLASRQGTLADVFNPTVPGKSVYALFAFAAINGFGFASQNLGGDIMILINDVAKVLHGEVFRWGFGNSGQCNKNLGGSFLMVFRIGLVKEVIEKLEQATNVIFSTKSAKSSNLVRRRHRSGNTSVADASSPSSLSTLRSTSVPTVRSSVLPSDNKAMSLSLQSLPGINTFTDRAVIGMLKSYAGIYRDKKIRDWNQDFRLSAGVGTFSVSMMFGMDAGWAVEGAVGSEYKIDATYLSPHVNMASRMTSACKQYGVTILLSQAVQELMSDVARSKLRHIDTVTVKGSSVRQRIYTFDARNKGVDFFLYSRSDEQADLDADRFSPNIWNTDQDLRSMRQHVSDEFLETFEQGRKAYLFGDWPLAIKKLEKANEIMVETAMEDGYLDDELAQLRMSTQDEKTAAEEIKRQNGDGPSQYLIKYMKSHGGIAPRKWQGWHALSQK